MSEPGLYPTVPVTREWFLDKGRLHLQLKSKRKQLPLTPAFAMTAHAAQGQTFSKGAIVDLNIGGSSSAMSSYVALTRVERREDLLIYRPFPIDLFTKGQKPGLELLLRVWRKEFIDWKAIDMEHMPSKRCPGCDCVQYKHAYPMSEWNKKDKRGNCSKCMARRKEAGRPFECNVCFAWLPEVSFQPHQRGPQSTNSRT